MLFPQIDGLADGESADYYKGLLQRYYYYPIRDRSIRDRSLGGVCMFYAAWSRKTLSNFVLPALNCAEGRRRVLITIDTWRDFLGSKKRLTPRTLLISSLNGQAGELSHIETSPAPQMAQAGSVDSLSLVSA